MTRCTNNFGPYQYPEKVIPLFTTNLLDGKQVPLYGDGLNERDWLFVDDHCSRRRTSCCTQGTPGEIYNIGAGNETPNRELVDKLLALLGKGEEMSRVRRPTGSATTAATRSTSPRSRALGWRKQRTLDEALAETVDWYRDNRWWWEPLKADADEGVLVTGAGGQVGHELVDAASPATTSSASTTRTLDVADRDAVLGAITAHPPRRRSCNAAAWTAVDACESDPDRAFARQRDGHPPRRRRRPRGSARTSCYVSTDYVFDGTQDRAVRRVGHAEPAVGVRPIEAGRRARARSPDRRRRAHVVGVRRRTAATWSRRSCASPASTTTLAFVDDQRGHPTFADDLARDARAGWSSIACPGTFHVTNQGAVSWFEFAQAVLAAAGLDPERVSARSRPPSCSRPAPRPGPANSVLDNAALRLCGIAAAARLPRAPRPPGAPASRADFSSSRATFATAARVWKIDGCHDGTRRRSRSGGGSAPPAELQSSRADGLRHAVRHLLRPGRATRVAAAPGDPSAAEDAAADAIARVWPKWAKGRVDDFWPYLRVAVVNQVRGRGRRLAIGATPRRRRGPRRSRRRSRVRS